MNQFYGDLRGPNVVVLIDENGSEFVKLLDFDWGGKEGAVLYPADINMEQPGRSQFTRFKEIRLHDHPASAVLNARDFLASMSDPLTVDSRSCQIVHGIQFPTTPPAFSRQHLLVTHHEDNAPIHAGASFNGDNVHDDALEHFNLNMGNNFCMKKYIPRKKTTLSGPILHGNLSSNLQILNGDIPTPSDTRTYSQTDDSNLLALLLHLKSCIQPPKFETTNGFYILNTKMELSGSFCTNTTLYLRISKRQHLSTPEHISYSYVSSRWDTFARIKAFPCRKQSVRVT